MHITYNTCKFLTKPLFIKFVMFYKANIMLSKNKHRTCIVTS